MITTPKSEEPKCFVHDKRMIEWDKITARYAMQGKLCAECQEWLRDIFDGLPEDLGQPKNKKGVKSYKNFHEKEE